MSVRYLMSYGNSNRIMANYNTKITKNWNDITILSTDKVNNLDLSTIIESGTSSSRAIPKHTYFYLNDTLVQAKTNILQGVTFIKNGNYEEIPEGSINRIKKYLSDVSTKILFKFGINSDNKYGYYKLNTSTVIPFNDLIPVNPESTVDLNYYIEE